MNFSDNNPTRDDRIDTALLALGMMVLIFAFVIVYGRQNTEIEKLKADNHCLRHPELWIGGTSSVTAVRVNGKFQVTQGGRGAVCR